MLPVIDLHCDLLPYLAGAGDADPSNADHIGCAIPHLRDGRVAVQVLAIYTGVEPHSVTSARRQASLFTELLRDHRDSLYRVEQPPSPTDLTASPRVGVVASVENASALCSEDEPRSLTPQRMDEITGLVGRLLSISLTHHGENRFGGGNACTAGLKDDGRALVELLDGRGVAVDVSHASDALAADILELVDSRSLEVPVVASHSNFRSVHATPRNMPDWLAVEIARRRGLIGLALLRAMVHPTDPGTILRHLEYGFELGCGAAMCMGADFFDTRAHPDQSRAPFFLPGHEHAGRYPELLRSFRTAVTADQVADLAYRNALGFMHRTWGDPSSSRYPVPGPSFPSFS